MASRTDLTLGDLARIALGSPSLGPANIAVLHSLIDLLLKKLDCREEKVSIGGYESRCLRQLLESTTIPSYAFQEDQIEILTEKFERINILEERVNAVSTRLEKHFDEIRECNKEGFRNTFGFEHWERYNETCEDLCMKCDPDNVIACDLLTNIDFMKKMLRRISYPLVERMFNFETLVENLHEDFLKFVETSKEHYMKMVLVERAIQEIEHLKQQVDEHHLQFLGAMEEVQDMFDAKLDKIHLPALKKYIRDRFDSIDKSLNSLRQSKSCPEPGGVIMDGIRCLSCGNRKVASEKTILVKGTMPDVHVKRRPKLKKRYCNCKYQQADQVDIAQQLVRLVPGGRGFHLSQLETGAASPAKKCKVDDFVMSEGMNGMLYRMDPEAVAAKEIEKKEKEVSRECDSDES